MDNWYDRLEPNDEYPFTYWVGWLSVVAVIIAMTAVAIWSL